MVENLLPGDPLLGVDGQHSLDQILDLGLSLNVPELQGLGHYIFFQLVQVLPSPWGAAVQHLVEYNPYRPYIAFG